MKKEFKTIKVSFDLSKKRLVTTGKYCEIICGDWSEYLFDVEEEKNQDDTI